MHFNVLSFIARPLHPNVTFCYTQKKYYILFSLYFNKKDILLSRSQIICMLNIYFYYLWATIIFYYAHKYFLLFNLLAGQLIFFYMRANLIWR